MGKTADDMSDVLNDAADLAETGSKSDEVETPGADLVGETDFSDIDEELASESTQETEEAEDASSDVEETQERDTEVSEVSSVEESAEEVETSKEEQQTSAELPSLEELLLRLANLEKDLREARAPAEDAQDKTAQSQETDDGERLRVAREEAMGQLASETYALSKEDADRVIAEPEAILPNLAARVHMEVLQSVLLAVREQLPGWISATQKEAELRATADEAFFEQWPALRDHPDTVRRMRGAYRALNPDADLTAEVKEVGAQALLALGLVPARADAAETKPSSTPHKPAAAKPTATSRARKPATEYEEMALDDDLGL